MKKAVIIIVVLLLCSSLSAAAGIGGVLGYKSYQESQDKKDKDADKSEETKATPTPTKKPAPQGQKYEGDTYTMYYPNDWELKEDYSTKEQAFFLPTDADDGDGFVENLNIYSQAVTDSDLDSIELANDTLDEIKKDGSITSMTSKSVAKFEIAGYDGAKLSYAGKTSTGRQIEFVGVIVIADGRGYMMTFTTDPSDLSKYEDDLDFIFENFTIEE